MKLAATARCLLVSAFISLAFDRVCLAEDFCIEDGQLKPLPADVAEVLRKDASFAACLKEAGDLEGRPVGLTGMAIDLDGDGQALDWVATTSIDCFRGAAVGPIWVLRQQAQGHAVVFTGSTYFLKLGTGKRGGLRNLILEMATAGSSSQTLLGFDGSKYVIVGNKTTSAAEAEQKTTPTPPAPGEPPPAEIHPILLEGRALGGVLDRRWFDLEKLPMTVKGKPASFECDSKKHRIDLGGITGGETYRLFSRQGPVGTGKGSRFTWMCTATASLYFEIAIKPATKEGKTWRYAIGGDWDALPRLAKKQKNRWVVDVNGDGQDDMVRVVSKKGKSKEGAPTTVTTYTLEMGDKKLRLERFESEVDEYSRAPSDLEFVDLNGDGILDFLFTVSGFDPAVLIVDVSSGRAERVAGYSDNSD